MSVEWFCGFVVDVVWFGMVAYAGVVGLVVVIWFWCLLCLVTWWLRSVGISAVFCGVGGQVVGLSCVGFVIWLYFVLWACLVCEL